MGYLLSYVFSDALGSSTSGESDSDYSEHVDLGPRALAQQAIDSGRFAQCTVHNLWTRIMARPPSTVDAHELAALANAHGVTLKTIGPYHVDDWTRRGALEAVELVMSSPLAGSQSRHSAFQDVEKGLTTEFSTCVGPLLEDAKIKGVPLPKTQALYAALMGLEASLAEPPAS